MQFRTLVAVTLMGAANALPAAPQTESGHHPASPHGGPTSGPSRAQRGEKRVANFDQLESTPADAIVSIGQYKDLNYEGFVTIEAGVNHQGASDNVAVYGLHSELKGPYVISADYEDSNIKDFDLSSLYYSCAAITGDSEATEPAACTIRATGYDTRGNSVVSREFDYNARRLSSPMEHVRFGVGFSHVHEVRFETSSAGDEMVATIFDDVKYTVYKKPGADDAQH